MTTDVPSPLVPKLRFPEFRVDTTWLAPRLADLYGFKRTNTLSRDNLNYEFGTIRNIHYGDIHTKFKPLFRLENEHVPYVNLDVALDGFDDDVLCEEGDIVLADASEDLDDVGKAIEVVSLNGKRVVAGTHTILATRRGSVPVVGFAGQLFQSTAVRTGIKREAQGAKVYGISANRISAIPVPVPPTEVEQQKIADCLGSLDDLIAADGRKLEALRQYKQGLMQQLFPQASETQPRLRFPEFQDTQEWRVAPLGKLFETTTGGTPDRARPDYWGGEVPWVTTSIVDFNIIESTRESISSAGLSNSSAKVFPKRTVLMALYGQGKTRGKVAMLGVEAATNQACAAILPSDEVDPRFVFLNLSGRYEEIRANSNSGGQENLSQALVRDLPFAYPKERAEQHRIAECLTALDEQIAAQARKLETLKQHKRGLLQQLFPKPEAA